MKTSNMKTIIVELSGGRGFWRRKPLVQQPFSHNPQSNNNFSLQMHHIKQDGPLVHSHNMYQLIISNIPCM